MNILIPRGDVTCDAESYQ